MLACVVCQGFEGVSLPGEGGDPGAEGAVRVQVLCDELQVELLVAGGILACRLLALRRHNLVEGAEACVDVLRNRRILPSSPL